MPSVSDRVHVDVDFEWSDVITTGLQNRDINAIAEAVVKAGHFDAILLALYIQKRGSDSGVTCREHFDLGNCADHLVDDFLRGIPIEPHIRSIARHHCNRIII